MTSNQKLEFSREVRQWIKVGIGAVGLILMAKNSNLNLNGWDSFDISRIIRSLKGDAF